MGEIGHRLGRKALAEVANAALPETILGWFRKLVARKFDGSKARRGAGRPRTDSELERLIVKMARENPGWGYDRILGALANLGHEISDQTVDNILKRDGVPTAPERKHTTGWADFIRAHMAVLAGTDFFSVEVLTLRGLVTYYVLFFIRLESRQVEIAGVTRHPAEGWMKQIARNVTLDGWGFLEGFRYLLHDRDSKYTRSFRVIIEAGLVNLTAPGPQSEPQCLCGTLGPIGEGRMSLQADTVQRSLIAAGAERICGALSCRAQSPRQRQRVAVSSINRYPPCRRGAVPRTARGVATVLSSPSSLKGEG